MNCSNPNCITVTGQPIVSGWLDGDVGVVGDTGKFGLRNGTFTVNGAGALLGGSGGRFSLWSISRFPATAVLWRRS